MRTRLAAAAAALVTAAVAPAVAGTAAGPATRPVARNTIAVPSYLPTHGRHAGQGTSDPTDRRRAGKARPPRTSSPNMTWHSGAVLPSTTVAAVFWGTSWSTYNGDEISGTDQLYTAMNGSGYARTSDEYTGTNGQVSPTVSYTGHLVDPAAAPASAPSTSAVLAEAAKLVPTPSPNEYIVVYGDTTRGGAGYCAWHSYGTIGGVPVEIGWVFKLDGDPGCDPGAPYGARTEGLAASANVAAHELSEARTDPANGGWWDPNGQENGDKCAWTFPTGTVTLSDGSSWRLQAEWSNAAYTAGTGYPNAAGQRGCLAG